MKRPEHQIEKPSPPIVWRIVQALSLLLGIAEVVLLLVNPTLGIHLLWNLLIPLAPLVFMLVPGVWRNVCPMGVLSQLPRRLGMQSSRKLSANWQVFAMLAGWSALLLIVPMRHLWFDRSGLLTAVVLMVLGTTALMLGLLFDGKSGWCSTCCPVHIVEKLYGQRTAVTVPNAHCDTCSQCVIFCPDRDPGPDRLLQTTNAPTDAGKTVSHLMIGGFAGYVYGWFQCPDLVELTAANVASTYLWPFGAMAVSMTAYLICLRALRLSQARLSKLFAAAAIAIYYWFRIPMLFGVGRFGLDGSLTGLVGSLPTPAIIALQVAVVALILLWLARGLIAAAPWMKMLPIPIIPAELPAR